MFRSTFLVAALMANGASAETKNSNSVDAKQVPTPEVKQETTKFLKEDKTSTKEDASKEDIDSLCRSCCSTNSELGCGKSWVGSFKPSCYAWWSRDGAVGYALSGGKTGGQIGVCTHFCGSEDGSDTTFDETCVAKPEFK